MKRIISICLVVIMMLSMSAQISVMAASQEIKVTVDGKNVSFPDVKPQIIQGRTLVPLRSVFETLGGNVEWNQSNKTATITVRANSLDIKIGSDVLVLNNKKLAQKLDVPAQLLNSRTMIPLRYAAEALGFNVQWDNNSRTVKITGTGVSANQAYIQAESIFQAIGTTKNKAGTYFKNGINNVASLKSSLEEMDGATKRANSLYSAGFLIIDITNIATSVSSALEKGCDEVADSIMDAQETMMSYVDSSENISVSDWFVASARASYSDYLKLSEKLLSLHVSRIDKGYFTYNEAVSYSTIYYMMMADRKTLSTAVELLINNAADGLLSGVALTAKKFTLNLLPGALSDNIQNMIDIGGDTMRSYYSAITDYRNKLSKVLY